MAGALRLATPSDMYFACDGPSSTSITRSYDAGASSAGSAPPALLSSKKLLDDFGMVVLRSALLLAISSLPGAQSLAAGKWLTAGRAGPLVTAEADTPATAGSWKLGLLPFPLAECLLPGESKQVHLYEARFIQLFADAASSHHDCLGAMYFTPSGNVASVSTLLEVEEYKKVVALASVERERTRRPTLARTRRQTQAPTPTRTPSRVPSLSPVPSLGGVRCVGPAQVRGARHATRGEQTVDSAV